MNKFVFKVDTLKSESKTKCIIYNNILIGSNVCRDCKHHESLFMKPTMDIVDTDREGYVLCKWEEETKDTMENTLGIDVTKIPKHMVRVVDEYTELESKILKLTSYIHSDCFTSDVEEQVRLIQQLGFMNSYQQILVERLEAN